MLKKAMMIVSFAALTLLIAACGGPAVPGGGPGGTVDPEEQGTWDLDFGGTDYSSSSADDSYAAGWWNSSTGELIVWVWTDYDYSGTSSDDGIWTWYMRDAAGEETVYAYDYTGGTLTFYSSESSADVTANLTTQTGSTYYQGVGVGKVTGSFSATVTESGTTDTVDVSVTNLDAVLYDYAAYATP